MSQSPTATQLNAILQDVEQTYRDFVSGLNEQQRHQVSSLTAWSAKDELSHCLYWIERLFERIEAQRNGQPIPNFDNYLELNDQNFEATKDESWSDITQRMARTFRHGQDLIGVLSAEQLAQPLEDNTPLWQMVIGNFCEHPLTHFATYYIAHGNGAWALQRYEKMVNSIIQVVPERTKGALLYNQGCFLALNNMPDQALAKVKEGLQLRPDLKEYAKQDTDLKSLWDLPVFKALVS